MAIYRQNAATGPTPVLHRQFVWSGSQLVAMYGIDDGGTPLFSPPELLARFVYVPGSRVPAYGVYPAGTTLNSGPLEKIYQFVTDQVGSIRLTIDTDTGLPYRRTDYDAFGGVLRDTRPEFHPFGFAGGIDLRGPALVRFGARDYDPVTGRWTARDPILFDGGQENLYVYCGNDPVNCVDPSGTAAETPYDVLSLGLSLGEFAFAPGPWTAIAVGLDALAVITPFVPAPGVLIRSAGAVDDVADTVRTEKRIGGIGFGSFSSFKRAVGSAGDGYEWHHIVGQTRGNIRSFGAEAIHNTANLVAIDVGIHRRINGFYSSIPKSGFTNGLKVRDWLSTQSYQYHMQFGIQILQDFGVIK